MFDRLPFWYTHFELLRSQCRGLTRLAEFRFRAPTSLVAVLVVFLIFCRVWFAPVLRFYTAFLLRPRMSSFRLRNTCSLSRNEMTGNFGQFECFIPRSNIGVFLKIFCLGGLFLYMLMEIFLFYFLPFEFSKEAFYYIPSFFWVYHRLWSSLLRFAAHISFPSFGTHPFAVSLKFHARKYYSRKGFRISLRLTCSRVSIKLGLAG